LNPPKGYTTATIKADAEKTAGGFILPNSRVDVMWLEDQKEGGRRKCKTVLENVLVLAVDTIKDRSTEKNATVASPSNVTLAVKEKETKELQLWEQKGRLRLALRDPRDDFITKSEGTESPLDPESTDVARPKKPTIEVAVAAENLAPKTVLTKKHFKMKKFLKEDKPKNALDLKELEGKTLQQPVPEDLFVSALDLEELPVSPKTEPGTEPPSGTGTTPEAESPHRLKIIRGFDIQEVEIKDPSKAPKKKAEKK